MAENKKKSAELIPKIIEATTRDAAITVLNDVVASLNLSNSYKEMVRLDGRIKSYQKEFKEITSGVSSDIMSYEELTNIRVRLNFLYRDIQDELSHDVNSHKIYYEEIKTSRRADGMEELSDSEIASKYGAKSTSALKDILGASESYRRYSTEMSIAYGNYKALESLLDSIRLFTDSIASRERRELIILSKDVK